MNYSKEMMANNGKNKRYNLKELLESCKDENGKLCYTS